MQLHLDGRPIDEHAMDVLRTYEPPNGEGYELAYSGGKDSDVLLDLTKRSGVKFTARYSYCPLDPIELRRHIATTKRDSANHLTYSFAERSLIAIARERGIMPLRTRRWCCEVIKERPGTGKPLLTGIRWAESNRRKKRQQVETYVRISGTFFVHPIIDWKTSHVWEYLRERKIEICCLYAEGFKRLGCVGCPMVDHKEREFERFPFAEKIWRRINQVTWEAKGNRIFLTAEDQWRWWIGNTHICDDECPLFDGVLEK
jgi:phosphoadenosine phosphosulfate reductase